MTPVMRGEKEFLARLAAVDYLKQENPVLDGAALVFQIRNESILAELLVEVRLSAPEHFQDARLLAFLQNLGDTPLKIDAPEFVLTSGLLLAWKVGIVIMANEYRGELGEALKWETHLDGSEDIEMLAAEVGQILDSCRALTQS
jgi:hypothetical protein